MFARSVASHRWWLRTSLRIPPTYGRKHQQTAEQQCACIGMRLTVVGAGTVQCPMHLRKAHESRFMAVTVDALRAGEAAAGGAAEAHGIAAVHGIPAAHIIAVPARPPDMFGGHFGVGRSIPYSSSPQPTPELRPSPTHTQRHAWSEAEATLSRFPPVWGALQPDLVPILLALVPAPAQVASAHSCIRSFSRVVFRTSFDRAHVCNCTSVHVSSIPCIHLYLRTCVHVYTCSRVHV